jgi:hypothetical protein
VGYVGNCQVESELKKVLTHRKLMGYVY